MKRLQFCKSLVDRAIGKFKYRMICRDMKKLVDPESLYEEMTMPPDELPCDSQLVLVVNYAPILLGKIHILMQFHVV